MTREADFWKMCAVWMCFALAVYAVTRDAWRPK